MDCCCMGVGSLNRMASRLSSSSSVKSFAAAYPDADFTRLTAACIGRQTCETARRFGMRCHMAEKATMESLLSLVIALKQQ